MGAFGIIFVVILAFMLWHHSKAKNVANRFDIAYCGEVPNEATHLHYGDGIGKELKRVGFIKTILNNSSRYFYDNLAKQVNSFSNLFRKLYSGNLAINFNIAIIFVIILLWWSLK